MIKYKNYKDVNSKNHQLPPLSHLVNFWNKNHLIHSAFKGFLKYKINILPCQKSFRTKNLDLLRSLCAFNVSEIKQKVNQLFFLRALKVSKGFFPVQSREWHIWCVFPTKAQESQGPVC